MSEHPPVAVVMTAKGEPAERIERALATIAAEDYPGAVDVVIAAPPGDVNPSVGRVVDNPTGNRSVGLNLAYRAAAGDYVVRVDARTLLPPDYISRCVARHRSDPSIGVVGGVQHAESPSRAVVAAGVCRALRNPWATGGAAHRRVGAGGEVDTVYLGVFRRRDLERLGGWDERLVTNQDFDLSHRYRASGMSVWLEEGLVVHYEPRVDLGAIWRQYVAFGRGKVTYWRLTGDRPSRRQWLALAALPAVVVAAALRPLTLVVAAAGLVVLDHVADPAERDPRVRAVALVAYVPIIGGWLAGVVAEVTRRSRA